MADYAFGANPSYGPFSNKWGNFQARESLLSGPGGFLELESTWEVLPGGTSRFVIAKPFGGP